MLKIITINAITQYIEDNLEKHKINTEEIVKFTDFSRRYLQLHFKEHVGIPIEKYIKLRRISRAAVLLKLTNQSLITINFFMILSKLLRVNSEKTRATHPCNTENIKHGHF